MNVYYSHNVIRKQKYMNIKHTSKAPEILGLAPYKGVAKKIRSVDIRTSFSICRVCSRFRWRGMWRLNV